MSSCQLPVFKASPGKLVFIFLQSPESSLSCFQAEANQSCSHKTVMNCCLFKVSTPYWYFYFLFFVVRIGISALDDKHDILIIAGESGLADTDYRI